jgi:hypothetical protein
VRQHWNDVHRDVASAGRLCGDVSGDRRSQRLRDLPAELAPEDDVDQRFVVSEQSYVDRAAYQDEAGHHTEGHRNSAADALLEIEVLAADTPKGKDHATTEDVQGQDIEQQQVEGVTTVLGRSERQSDANHRGRRDKRDRDLHADDCVD